MKLTEWFAPTEWLRRSRIALEKPNVYLTCNLWATAVAYVIVGLTIVLLDFRGSTALVTMAGALGVGYLGQVYLKYRVKLATERARPRSIKRYSCAFVGNQGTDADSEGELLHSRGHAVNSDNLPACLRGKTKQESVWMWTPVAVGRKNRNGSHGASTIYGPYSTDFDGQGTYIARFRLACLAEDGWAARCSDSIIIVLDVAKKASIPDTMGGDHSGPEAPVQRIHPTNSMLSWGEGKGRLSGRFVAG